MSSELNDADAFIVEREVIATPFDPSVESLVKQIDDKLMVIKPGFQRGEVWDSTKKSRLIESLLLNIPIPPIYLAEEEDGTRVVVDGQQRLRAIEQFLHGQFALAGLTVLAGLNGRRWADLSARAARIIRNRSLRAIVISYRSDPQVRYEVFERLNTGGMKLLPQELRNSLYRGDLNELLHELSKEPLFLKLRRANKPHNRLDDNELILRYFTLRHHIADYRPPLNALLDDFMGDHREMHDEDINDLRELFISTVTAVLNAFGDDAYRLRDASGRLGPLNRVVFDLHMLSMEAQSLPVVRDLSQSIVQRFNALVKNNSEFRDAITRSTADRTKFYRRLRIWGQELAGLGLAPWYVDALPTVEDDGS